MGRWLWVFLTLPLVSGHQSYQIPPSGVRRPADQTYGTPPPRVYSTSPPTPPPTTTVKDERTYDKSGYETPAPPPPPPQSYEAPQEPPREQNYAQPRGYETPPPPCPNGGRRHPATGDCLVNECETGQNDCDSKAKCIDTFDSYTCACQSGYIDEGPADRPGRQCALPTNTCSTGKSGCSPDAICADTYNGVSCKCKLGYVDLSEDPRSKPGQICKKLVNECADPSLNTCSRDADCTDTFDSYTCTCKAGFHDVDPSNPGRECERNAVNECLRPVTNNCSPNANCIDEPDGYRCECRRGFEDFSPPGRAGRICRPKLSPCQDPTKNDCSPNAICTDDSKATDGYTCRCKDGFSDKSTNPLRPGRECVAISTCDKNDCDPSAVCENTPEGFKCTCPSGTTDLSPDKAKPGRKCEKTTETPIALVIVKNGTDDLIFSSKFASNTNKPAVELSEIFGGDLGKTVAETKFGPAHIKTDVVKLGSPKSVQPNVDDGIIINSTVITRGSAPVNACELFDAVVEKIQASGGFVGTGQLKIGDDVQKLNPCPKPLCGGKICNAALGEVCINGECVTDYCVDNFCPANSTCVNQKDHAECVCLPGFVDVRNASVSIRLASGLKEDQYCLRAVDVDFCALGLHNCSASAHCVSIRGGFTCKCDDGYVDGNPAEPGRICAALSQLEPSTLPWWLMLLLALLFLLLTLCCCLWALSRLRWFRRRGLLDQSGSSYSDLVIPRPKIRSLDAESMGSGSSEFTIGEEIERRVVEEVTRTEQHIQETEEESNEHETYTHHENVHQERMIR